MRLRFTKMHGLGNDFVMLDGISQKLSLTPQKVKRIADRHFGGGCDQVLLVEPPRTPEADFRYRIYNNDGGEVENCGNGARCFAVFVRQRGLTNKKTIRVETKGGGLMLHVNDEKNVTVNMGVPTLSPKEIPIDTTDKQIIYPLTVAERTLKVSAISMGNPHAVTVVDEVSSFPVHKYGPLIEHHPFFPNKVNAGFLEILSRGEGNLRVHERGAGETLACGTGACAAMVAGRLLNLFDNTVTLNLPGGSLNLCWDGDGHPVMMTGPAISVFQGQLKI